MIWVKCPTCSESAVGSKPIYPAHIASFSFSSVLGIMSCNIPLHRNSSTKLIIFNTFLAHKDRFLSVIQKAEGLIRYRYIYTMNFLSHYYFDQDAQNSNKILGTILPDLFKNANKSWNPRPQKKPELFTENEDLSSLLEGWKRHLEVDLIFHSSAFFVAKTTALKIELIPILKDSVVRPSFLAHIGLELLLDHLLIQHDKISIDSFYNHLDKVNINQLKSFLEKCEITDDTLFFKFLESFKSSKYLLSYRKIDNISYALERICMRLWQHPFTEKTRQELTIVLELYKKELEADFMIIFEEIETRLI